MEKRLDQVIDSLESKLNQLLTDYSQLKLAYAKSLQDLELERQNNKRLEGKSIELAQQNQILKNTNALLGSDEYKRETKLKINALVKEIDQCIAQLS